MRKMSKMSLITNCSIFVISGILSIFNMFYGQVPNSLIILIISILGILYFIWRYRKINGISGKTIIEENDIEDFDEEE